MKNDNILDRVHELLAQRLIDQLSDNETATPGVMQAARGFLKDNAVDGLPVPGSALEGVRDSIPFPVEAVG